MRQQQSQLLQLHTSSYLRMRLTLLLVIRTSHFMCAISDRLLIHGLVQRTVLIRLELKKATLGKESLLNCRAEFAWLELIQRLSLEPGGGKSYFRQGQVGKVMPISIYQTCTCLGTPQRERSSLA